jgi:hypothetical protein
MADYSNAFRPSYYIQNFVDPNERCQHLSKNYYPHNDPAYTPYVDPRFYDPNYHRQRMPQHHGHGYGYQSIHNVPGHKHRVYTPSCPGCNIPLRRLQ